MPFSVADEDGEKSVSILLDGEESTMEFIDVSEEEVKFLIITSAPAERVCH